MSGKHNHVCPVERAGHLDSKFRRWLQNPHRLLKPYVSEGMTVLDFGCGPGFFTVPLAELAGQPGRVIAADLQEGMLRKLEDKIRGTSLVDRITLHRTGENSIGVTGPFDFIVAVFVVHEVPDQDVFFREVAGLLKTHGRMFIAEPPFRVSARAFRETLANAGNAGLLTVKKPWVLMSRGRNPGEEVTVAQTRCLTIPIDPIT